MPPPCTPLAKKVFTIAAIVAVCFISLTIIGVLLHPDLLLADLQEFLDMQDLDNSHNTLDGFEFDHTNVPRPLYTSTTEWHLSTEASAHPLWAHVIEHQYDYYEFVNGEQQRLFEHDHFFSDWCQLEQDLHDNTINQSMFNTKIDSLIEEYGYNDNQELLEQGYEAERDAQLEARNNEIGDDNKSIEAQNIRTHHENSIRGKYRLGFGLGGGLGAITSCAVGIFYIWRRIWIESKYAAKNYALMKQYEKFRISKNTKIAAAGTKQFEKQIPPIGTLNLTPNNDNPPSDNVQDSNFQASKESKKPNPERRRVLENILQLI